jgi:bifunctional non-homologous end joining protein LigD
MAMARPKPSRVPKKSADKQLSRYRSMRDFEVTNEPSGSDNSGESRSQDSTLPFVLQKHAATRLHYDFRLGWNGVLKSWAVTKGPSYFPGDKRLAVQVEDHPLDYGGFEGIIPKGQYGGGTVMLWDRGTWEPHVDVDEGLKKGSLKFALHGEKMKGNWALVRMGGRAANETKPNWLLIKEHDQEERRQDDTPITEEAPDSVLSGRDLKAIAEAGDRVWNSNKSQAKASDTAKSNESLTNSAKASRPGIKKAARTWLRELAKTPRESLPRFVEPQLASLSKSVPASERWVHELKLDGYRIEVRIDKKEKPAVQLLTRSGLDWTYRMKAIADAVLKLPVDTALLDGEVVVLGANGATSFADLQAAFQEGAKHSLTYFAFDLLHLDGHNLRDLPLLERKALLAKVLSGSSATDSVRFSEHLTGDAEQIFGKACELGAEGIVSKLAQSQYSPGHGTGWLKQKCYQEQEFVIGGFTLPSNGTHGVGALLLGYYRSGELIYAGRTGTGFTQKTHRMMRDRLDKLRTRESPYRELPADMKRGVTWVKPELVAQVSFATWTADNLVRQAAFKGLREDKPAKAVQQEKPQIDPNKSARKGGSQVTTSLAPPAGGSRASTGESASLPIRLTHPDKILDTTTGLTKEQLARYYIAISEVMFPYIADRPLTLVRCLDGSEKPCFYQKHKNQMLSDGFGSIDIVDKKTGKPEPYITLSSPTSIAELAQIGVLEVHPWGSRNETLEQPDRMIFDLDPDAAISWETIAASALEVRKRLMALGLKSFVKSTGGKGLHVVIPIVPEQSWPAVKQFAHEFVLALEKDAPSLFLTKMTKAARAGKIYLDYLRNERGATAVAPFSPRARAGLPVAMPLGWAELKAAEHPRFLVSEFQQWRTRLAKNPWKDMLKLEQKLKPAESD